MLTSATLLGSSSGRNSGDAALMAAIVECVDRACGAPLTYEIPTIKPSYIRSHYPQNAKPVGMLPWNLSVKMLGIPTYRSVMRTDLTLIFDAILFDRSLLNPLFNFMSTLYLLLPLAKRKGRKLACYDIGAGPVSTPLGRRMLRELCDMMDFVTVRDQASSDILMDVGVRNPRVLIAADAALNAPSSGNDRVHAILREKGIEIGRPILAFNINRYIDTWSHSGREPLGRQRFLAEYARGVDRVMGDIDAQFVFVTTQHADVDITRQLIGMLKNPDRIKLLTSVEFAHRDMKGILRNVSLLFGMRVHSMILASSELTPIVGLAYQPKVHHYYSTLGLKELSMDFRDFSESAVYEHVVGGWSRRARIREQLEKRIPELKQEALKPAELIAAMHRGEDLDTAFLRARGMSRQT